MAVRPPDASIWYTMQEMRASENMDTKNRNKTEITITKYYLGVIIKGKRMKTLHLVLKSKWYDKIASGEKTSEYRECKPYWNKKFTGDKCKSGLCLKYTTVVFHKGYTATTMEFEIRYIDILYGANDLNLPYCWEIKLGQRITKWGDNE